MTREEVKKIARPLEWENRLTSPEKFGRYTKTARLVAKIGSEPHRLAYEIEGMQIDDDEPDYSATLWATDSIGDISDDVEAIIGGCTLQEAKDYAEAHYLDFVASLLK